MSIEPQLQRMTAEQFFALPENHMVRELVRGEVVETMPAGAENGAIADNLAFEMRRHARSLGSGRTFSSDTGYTIFRQPDVVRAPDASYVSAERLPDPLPKGYLELTPDIAVEIASPSDRRRVVMEKVTDWVDAGTPVVVLVWPQDRRVIVYHGAADITTLTEADILTLEPMLPGFAMPVADIFA